MHRALIYVVLIVVAVAASPTLLATQLDLASLGSFTLGQFGSAQLHSFTFNEPLLTDGDTGTVGLTLGHAPPDMSNQNQFTLRYEFNQAQFVTDFRFFISDSQSRFFNTRIFTTSGVIEVEDPSAQAFIGTFRTIAVNDTVTHIHLNAPSGNRYSLGEIEASTVAVPEPSSWFLCIIAISAIGLHIRKK